MVDHGADMLTHVGKRGIIVGQELLGEVPVVGPVLELPMVLSNVAKAVNKVVTSGSAIVDTGVNTVRDVRSALAGNPAAVNNAFAEGPNLGGGGRKTIRTKRPLRKKKVRHSTSARLTKRKNGRRRYRFQKQRHSRQKRI